MITYSHCMFSFHKWIDVLLRNEHPNDNTQSTHENGIASVEERVAKFVKPISGLQVYRIIHITCYCIQVYPTNEEAAEARGLFDSDKCGEESLEQAASFKIPAQLITLFAIKYSFGDVTDTPQLWQKFKQHMIICQSMVWYAFATLLFYIQRHNPNTKVTQNHAQTIQHNSH